MVDFMNIIEAEMGKELDLIGQTFGKLQVISKAERQFDGYSYRTAWNCKCACGNYKIVSTKRLRNGSVKSCGCLQHKKYPYEDLSGKVFGFYTVVTEDLNRENDNLNNYDRYWICRCVCGKENSINEKSLKNGSSKSCGCMKGTLISNNKKFDKQTYVDKGDYVCLIIDDKTHVKIDKEDVEKCQKYRWFINNDRGYAYASVRENNKYRKILMHRYIMDVEGKNMTIDHISGDRLDNRKINLRICNISENQLNKPANRKNEYPGVIFNKMANKWESRIWHHDKNIYLGRYETKLEAIKSRIEAEDKYCGKYGYYNSRVKNNPELIELYGL